MGVLFNLITRRDMLFSRYCELRAKTNKTVKDQQIISSIIAKLAVIDEEIACTNK